MFIVVLGTVLVLIHMYIWKRLVKDTTKPGRTRWALTGILVAVIVVLIAALVAPRAFDTAESPWIAWPGYLWFGLVVYLFLTLLALEPVRLVLWVRAKHRPSSTPDESPMNRRLFLARAGAAAAGAASVGSTRRSRDSGSLWCQTSTSARWRGGRTRSGSSR